MGNRRRVVERQLRLVVDAMIQVTDDATLDGPTGGAWFSDDEVYRYKLWRRWSANPAMAFIMLNPSTADHRNDDPTIRRCRAFAHRETAGSLVVVNLWAYRSTDWKGLAKVDDPGGPDNEAVIRGVLDDPDIEFVVAAWGSHAPNIRRPGRGGQPYPRPDIAALAAEYGRVLWCLGTTDAGHPRHPLFVRADMPLEVWP